MSKKVYGVISLTGNRPGSLDAIDGSSLVDGDVAIAFIQNAFVYYYMLNESLGAPENSIPNIYRTSEMRHAFHSRA